MVQADDVQVVVLLSGWSTGSTSVAGYLDRCGAYTCPPHQTTDDERTPVAYEPRAYMQALGACVDEFTLEPKGQAEDFEAFFVPWLAQEKAKAAAAGCGVIALKHPLQTYLLPVLEDCAAPRYVVITRPFEAVEATRQRRGWHPVYGEAGAQQLYGVIYTWLHGAARPYLAVPYDAFRADPALRSDLLAWLSLEPDPAQLAEAEKWLR